MATTIEYALMAGAAYISNCNVRNQIPTPQGWTRYFHVPNNPDYPIFTGASGFEAVTFTNGSELVISFAGTDFSKGIPGALFTGDFWMGNIPLITGASVNGADQLVDAVEYYLAVKAANPSANITLTGHSLGGALASLVAVFFGETAFTFDQVPGRATAMHNSAILLRDKLLENGHTAEELASLNAYITAADPLNTNPNPADTLAVRELAVTNLNVEGEVASLIPLAERIGSDTSIPNETAGVGSSDLHSIALLNAYLQSNQTADPNKNLSDVTFKMKDVLGMIFDPNLFYNDPLNTQPDAPENFLERLVRHEAGVQPDPVTGTGAIEADAMVTRFTSDLWKLAQDGGLTMSDNVPGNPDLNELSKALTAFAMQYYYEDTANATNPDKQLFTDLGTASEGSNGIRFDMHDVSKDIAAAMDAYKEVDLSKAKGYEYFLNYLSSGDTVSGGTTIPSGPLSLAARTAIKGMISQLRDWYVQAGTGGMTATDTQNRGAFMLGGSGADTLTGGTKTDLLVGNAGDIAANDSNYEIQPERRIAA